MATGCGGRLLIQDFYRQGLFRTVLGASDLDDFLRSQWEEQFQSCDATNMYAQALTWYESDISANALYEGDLPKALSSIQARVLLLPSETDLYFRVADNEAELTHLRDAGLKTIPTVFGHVAGAPGGLGPEYEFLRRAVLTELDS